MKLINSLLISRQELENLVNLTATYFNLLPAQIFQDLIAWSFLKSLAMEPDHPFVFRGGTSLSQAFQLIHRFSEDIDVSILHPQKSLSFRKKIKQTIITNSEQLGFTIRNLDTIQSKNNFNRYALSFQSLVESPIQEKRPQFVLEVMLSYPPYPIEEREIQSYLYRFMVAHPNDGQSLTPHLLPFRMNVQAIERTFVDKIFALCDYHIKKEYQANSRHLYDLHQLIHHGAINLDLIKDLIPKVKTDRANFPEHNPSAHFHHNLKHTLTSIIDDQVYLDDFKNVTAELITKPVTYHQCIDSLKRIIALYF